MNETKQRFFARVLQFGSAFGTVLFGLAVLLWILGVGGALASSDHGRLDWTVLPQALPAACLFSGFFLSLRLSRSHLFAAAIVFLASTIASVVSFRYDMSHDRYQVHAFSGSGGCSHGYVTWYWWAYDD